MTAGVFMRGLWLIFSKDGEQSFELKTGDAEASQPRLIASLKSSQDRPQSLWWKVP